MKSHVSNNVRMAISEIITCGESIDFAAKKYGLKRCSIYRNSDYRAFISYGYVPSSGEKHCLKLIKEGADGDCIEWDQHKTKLGYGISYHNCKKVLAHRISYAMSRGIAYSEMGGVVIRHACDNPSCINPGHLSAGYQLDNVRDMHERGRAALSGPKGSLNSSAKLTEADIPIIRNRLSMGEGPSKIAKDFNVQKTSISRISLGKSWRHI